MIASGGIPQRELFIVLDAQEELMNQDFEVIIEDNNQLKLTGFPDLDKKYLKKLGITLKS